MNPQLYCHNKVAPRGSSLHYALLFAPQAHREGLEAAHAFYKEVTEIVHECSDPGVARVKLAWWREELARLFDGGGRHPVSQGLAPVIERHGLAKEYFEEIIDGTEMDLEYGFYPSFRELSVYCHRLSGSLTHLSVEICGYNDRNTVRYAHDLGMGLQLARLLRETRNNAHAGRIYIPEDEMQGAGVTRGDLLAPQTSERLRDLFKAQADRAREFFDNALERIPAEDRHAQRAGLILMTLYREQLDAMEEDGYYLLEHAVRLTPLRKLWVAWRTARRQKRLKKLASG